MKSRSFNLAKTRNAPRGMLRKACHVLAAAAYVALTATAANAQVSQTPLYLGGGNVPGNLTLVPSVEWPTINSVANLGAYDETRTYKGYFDAGKCYLYHYESTETNRYFYPDGTTADHRCTAANQWSGNFMNWAATQTIDPFRSVLTGGYRVVDTPTDTVLEKARHDGQGTTSIYPNRRLPNTGSDSVLVDRATPPNWDFFQMRVQGLGNKMRFTRDGSVDVAAASVVAYDPTLVLAPATVYEVSVRVQVCVTGLLEPNCRQYSQGYKPEGLIQQYSEDLRIGVFGYLNDPNMLRDGGVLRARQKFVGPTMIVPGQGETANPNVEWDTNTGVLIRNPNPTDATATAAALSISILDSGAINYLNKFGQMTVDQHKSIDPVSELFYTAQRYLKNQGNVPEYTSVPGATAVNATRAADGFPIITSWNEDPIQYACQRNVILGIGDVYTHRDKNLPGSTSGTDEPTKPATVTADTTVNVVTATNQVGQLEGLGNIGSAGSSWSGRNNSAFIAGLAYRANTTDIRPDITGTQTISTHWVDVLEQQTLEAPVENQYYLATKYGGMNIPDDVDFDPDTATGSDVQLEWWHTNDDTLTTFGNAVAATFPRPDNYYLAGGAEQMIESLTTAFARIADDLERSSASSVAANSTRVDTQTAVFQAAFSNSRWSGELLAFRIDALGVIEPTAAWNAATQLDALTDLAGRKIFTVLPPVAAGDGSLVSTSGIDFLWAGLSASQQDDLRQVPGGGTPVTATVGEARLDYLRGSRSGEPPVANAPFRQRDSRLGDIVNSDPQFVHRQDFGYTLLGQSAAFSAGTIGNDYRTFRQSADYLARPAMVIVGANDGMLHGFNATLAPASGDELFAFVPHAAFENLYELTLPEYEHRYFVDSTPRVADAYLTGVGWRTIVVGSTGAGGRSVFALDITDPETMTNANVLWEFTHPDMGFTRGQPAVAPLPNGEFGVIVTSGYETASDDGHIWILDPADGSIIHTIVVPDSGDLGPPLVVDLNSDRVADRIYVGDTLGNLWRFDLVGATTSTWQAPVGLRSGTDPLPLFVAEASDGTPQAITAPLASAFNENGQHVVFFGTGSFYRIDDNVVPNTPSVDSFYGVIDRGAPIADRVNLLEQEILIEATVSGNGVRGVTAFEMAPSQDGWYVDLLWKNTHAGPGPAGERVVSRAVVRGDRVVFSTLIPNEDPCAPGGSSWIMEVNAFNGGRLSYAVFDLNVDGDFDGDDWITITDEDGNEIRIPVSGIDPDIGITQTPAIIGLDEDEIKVLSGSSGALIRISERGGIGTGRQSWRELR